MKLYFMTATPEVAKEYFAAAAAEFEVRDDNDADTSRNCNKENISSFLADGQKFGGCVVRNHESLRIVSQVKRKGVITEEVDDYFYNLTYSDIKDHQFDLLDEDVELMVFGSSVWGTVNPARVAVLIREARLEVIRVAAEERKAIADALAKENAAKNARESEREALRMASRSAYEIAEAERIAAIPVPVITPHVYQMDLGEWLDY